MATFKVKDWVKVTPSPDPNWQFWSKEHNNALGKMAQVMDVDEDQYDPGIFYILVSFNDGTQPQWFLDKHLLLVSDYDAKLKLNLEKACEELQKWEKKKKDMVNESLKRAFGIEEEKEEEKKSTKQSSEKDQEEKNKWEETTEEIDMDQVLSDQDVDNLLELLGQADYSNFDSWDDEYWDDLAGGNAD